MKIWAEPARAFDGHTYYEVYFVPWRRGRGLHQRWEEWSVNVLTVVQVDTVFAERFHVHSSPPQWWPYSPLPTQFCPLNHVGKELDAILAMKAYGVTLVMEQPG